MAKNSKAKRAQAKRDGPRRSGRSRYALKKDRHARGAHGSESPFRKTEASRQDVYRKWITDNVPAFPSCLCTPISLTMRAAFPELVLMSGDITTASGQVYEHTWLQTEDGSFIVDPTVAQFGEKVAEYAATLHDGTDPDCECGCQGEGR